MSFEGTSGYRIKLGENISLTIAKKQMVSLDQKISFHWII